MVSPAEFIPLAEDTALIQPIGKWVLLQACRDASTWPAHERVSVNLSAVQLRSSAIVAEVSEALRESGLAPNRLELEITESAILNQTELALAILNDLKSLGVRISMDDFGTGYSSLSYLQKFPFDKIKIDKSFIDNLGDCKESMAIVRAVIGMGSSLGKTTTAEGVETIQQLELLRREGCSEIQGYFISKPVPAKELDKARLTMAA